MKQQLYESKLTPAAREAIEEMLQGYKDQIIRAAAQSAGNLTGELKEISVRDVLEAINLIQTKGSDRRSRLRSRIANILLLAGLMYSFLGILLLLYEGTNVLKQLPLMITATGVFTSILGFIYSYWVRKRPELLMSGFHRLSEEDQARDLSFAFLEKWQAIELEMRNLVSMKFGESRAKIPISALMEEFLHRGLFSKGDTLAFRELLQKRNEIVHKGPSTNVTELSLALKQADRILERIRSTDQ